MKARRPHRVPPVRPCGRPTGRSTAQRSVQVAPALAREPRSDQRRHPSGKRLGQSLPLRGILNESFPAAKDTPPYFGTGNVLKMKVSVLSLGAQQPSQPVALLPGPPAGEQPVQIAAGTLLHPQRPRKCRIMSRTVGARIALWEGFLPRWVGRMRQQASDVSIRSDIGFEEDLMRRLVEGEP